MQSKIFKELESDGTQWSPAIAEKYTKLYGELHQSLLPNRYQAKVVENVAYGPHERHVLDVYMPAETSPNKGLHRVMVFAHAGGLVEGDKALLKDLLYANIGHYLASYGIITVIPNYRLLPNVTYPGGSDDIQLVREWIYKNISKPEYGSGDPNKVVLAGNSAGALHIGTNIYAEGIPASLRAANADAVGPLDPPLAGVVFLSAPFYIDFSIPVRTKTLKKYFGVEDSSEIPPLVPLGLIEHVPRDSPVLDPRKLRLFIVLTQYDPKEVQDAAFRFVQKYTEYSPHGMLPEIAVVPGHNHISNVFSIGTEDDVQGKLLREFIESV